MSDRLTAEQVGELEAKQADAVPTYPRPSHNYIKEKSYIFHATEHGREVVTTWGDGHAETAIYVAALLNHAPSLLATAKREASQAAEIERLNARVRELEEALKFYADRKSYDGTKNLIDGGWGGSSLEAHSDIIADRGQRARTALGKEGRTC